MGSGMGLGKRRDRVPGGRPVQVLVKLSEDEASTIEQRAEAAGMTPASFLAVCGLADFEDIAGAQTAGLAWRNAAAAELLAVVRQARGIATNLNQLTAYTHSEKRLDDDISRAVVEVRAVMRRALEVADRLDPRRPR